MGDVTIIRPDNEEEWHEVRRLHITGSDAPVIAGVGFEDAYTRWAKKTGKIPSTGDKLRFRVGHALEPLIHRELEERRGLSLWDPGDRTVFVNANGWQAATLDRVVLRGVPIADAVLHDDLSGAIGIAQFKTLGQFRKKEWDDGPDEYTWIQVIHEMAVLGVEWGVAAGLIGLGDWADFDIYQEQDSLEALLEMEYKFYKHVIEDTPPPMGGESSKAAVNAIWARVDPEKTVFLPPAGGWDVKADAWLTLKDKQKQAKADLKAADDALAIVENHLKTACGEAERLEIEGVEGAFTWKQTTRKGYTVPEATFRTWRKVKK